MPQNKVTEQEIREAINRITAQMGLNPLTESFDNSIINQYLRPIEPSVAVSTFTATASGSALYSETHNAITEEVVWPTRISHVYVQNELRNSFNNDFQTLFLREQENTMGISQEMMGKTKSSKVKEKSPAKKESRFISVKHGKNIE